MLDYQRLDSVPRRYLLPAGGFRLIERLPRGSAKECGAFVKVVALLQVAPEEETDEAMAMAERLVAMRSKMSR